MRKDAQRAEDTGSNITSQLKNKTNNLQWFFLALDEPTDITDTGQLMLFIRGVNAKFEVNEKLTVINSPLVRIFSKNLRKIIQ